MKNNLVLFGKFAFLGAMLAAFAAYALLLAVCLVVALQASDVRASLIHDSALPVLAVFFAASAFPFFATTSNAELKGALQSLGLGMFIGSLALSSAYWLYWTSTTIGEIHPSSDPVLASAIVLHVISVIAAIVAVALWFFSCVMYVAISLNDSYRWLHKEMTMERRQ